MRFWPKTSKARKFLVALLALILMVVLWITCLPLLDKPSPSSLSKILVLDDCDGDFHASYRTEKRDPQGTLLKKLDRGGHTLAIDPADSSLWVAGHNRLSHYSNEGKKRGQIGGLSESQSYVIVFPTAAIYGERTP